MAEAIEPRRSPVHDLLSAHRAQWASVDGAAIARRLREPQVEAQFLQTVALCDLSALPKLGLKGPGGADWLERQGVPVPPAIYDTGSLADGGLVARVGQDEFFLESGPAGREMSRLREGLVAGEGGVWMVERQDGGFGLAGPDALSVMLQTCGVDLARAATGRLIMTRVAGVSCSILPQRGEDPPVYRLWVDPSFAVYLWEQLAQIAGDLGGGVVGVDCVELGLFDD